MNRFHPMRLLPLIAVSALLLTLASCPGLSNVLTSAAISIYAGDSPTPLQPQGSFSFGDVIWGNPKEVIFTIRNTGTAPLTLTSPERVSVGGSDPSNFNLTQPPDASVPAGGSTTFKIAFTPASTGSKSAIVTIKTDAPGLETLTFTLTGSGIKGWRTVGSAGFSSGAADYVSLAVDSADGTPYVAYVDQSISNGYPQVRKFASGTWSTLADPGDVSVTAPYYYTSLYIRASVPYLAYSYDADGYAVRVVWYDSGSSQWSNEGTFEYGGSTPHKYINLKDASGTLYVAFQDNDPYTLNGKGAIFYEPEGWYQSGSTTNTASFESLAFSVNHGYMAFKDDVTGKASVKFDGDGWISYGPQNFSEGTADYTSLAVDSADSVYVAYSDGANGGKVTVMKGNGSSWTAVGTKGFSAGAAGYISLAIDSNNILYVAYKDAGNANKLTVQRFNGTSWELVGTAGVSSGAADYVSLVLHGTAPFVAFKDEGASGKATVMKFE